MSELLNKQKKDLSLLIVEDSEEDYTTLLRILKKQGFEYPIYHCVDGDDALDFIFQTGEYSPEIAPRPTLILIDLNLPGTDGREVIEIIKNHQQLKIIPIVVFSTSSNTKDVQICYEQGVNSYMEKPVNFQTFSKNIEDFLSYWFETAILPDS
ncbi:MAG: response regulator [Okeania sp. SIO3H1]|uniref:response regulator n=1 Tax=Okeania sp. SIO1I7 TaxID=2607772 RepID=UPI0013CB79B0|nr:response regulator [Okeania sp. SIO1I7]NEN89350.1 response regulator [Okeania sp. SIO3H1]NET25086.1 response regulator [Okeania sp. SIO1I7]